MLIENPCYRSAALAFESYGARLCPLDVDRQGAQLDALGESRAPLAYVTPSHQFPTGATMPLERRLKLLEWAQTSGAYVIEDDYDCDYRFSGPPLTALAGLDIGHNVIYLGTFSKSVGAGIRTGFMVLPPQLIEPARTIKILLNFGHPWLEQFVLADFLGAAPISSICAGYARAYRDVRDTLLDGAQKRLRHRRSVGRGQRDAHHVAAAGGVSQRCRICVDGAARYGVRIHSLESGGAHDMGSPYPGELDPARLLVAEPRRHQDRRTGDHQCGRRPGGRQAIRRAAGRATRPSTPADRTRPDEGNCD